MAAEKVKDAFLRKVGRDQERRVLGPRVSRMPRGDGRVRYQFLIKSTPEWLERDSAAIEYLKKKVTAEKEKEWLLTIDVNPYNYM